jgi:ATP-binding cassette subfamily B multidrug efflux pump
VRFGYGKPTPVIDHFELTVKPGERIGLIGRSGAGKSTLVNLLLRFYDLDGGRIVIDGQDIAHVTQDSLRAHIGMVTQDTSLLHRSVRDNILYGRPTASEEEMVQASSAPTCTTSSSTSPTRMAGRATRPTWASAASSCRAGSASAWPSRA